MTDTTTANKAPVILIVDDEELIRTIFRDVLQRAGFSTWTVSDGDSALEVIAQLKPDLVLLDLVMPGKDGFRTCQEIRGLSEGNHTPVLVVTGHDDTESINRALEAGATDFISKPVSPDLLVNRVRYMLQASSTMKGLLESEASLACAQQIARLANWEWNPATGSLSWSKQIVDILGHGRSDKVASLEDFLASVDPGDRGRVKSGLLNAASNLTECGMEFTVNRADATVRTVKLLGRTKLAFAGGSPLIFGTLQDITDLRQAESRLVMLKEAVDSLPIGITMTDLHGNIVYSNPAEAEMHGYDLEELVGEYPGKLAPKERRRRFSPEKFREIGLWKRETVNVKKSGEEFPVQLTSVSVNDATGRYLGMVTACEDITTRKEAEKVINALAYYDNLTGLPNRGMFLDRLQQALALARREGQSVGLLFLDLDNFKNVNDTFGHDCGDKLLQEVAKRLSAGVRESDTLARLGGDEFVVILNSVDSRERPAIAAQRMLSMFTDLFAVAGEEICCHVSIGSALYPLDSADAEGLLKCADTAMYYAKGHGKSQYQVYSSDMNQKVMRQDGRAVVDEEGTRASGTYLVT